MAYRSAGCQRLNEGELRRRCGPRLFTYQLCSLLPPAPSYPCTASPAVVQPLFSSEKGFIGKVAPFLFAAWFGFASCRTLPRLPAMTKDQITVTDQLPVCVPCAACFAPLLQPPLQRHSHDAFQVRLRAAAHDRWAAAPQSPSCWGKGEALQDVRVQGQCSTLSPGGTSAGAGAKGAPAPLHMHLHTSAQWVLPPWPRSFMHLRTPTPLLPAA